MRKGTYSIRTRLGRSVGHVKSQGRDHRTYEALLNHRLTDLSVINSIMTEISVIEAMPKIPRTYSRFTNEILLLLAKQIRLARRKRHMSQSDLAARIGIARSTLQLIEKGDASVASGLLLEAAVLTGVDLFVPDATTLAPQIERIEDKLRLLPGSTRKPLHLVDDEF